MGLKEKQKEWLKPAGVFLAGPVFNNMAKKAFERDWYETALNLFDIAETVTDDHHEKVPICIFKSKAHRALANMEDSRYEALKAMAYNTKGSVLPYLNMANLLYHENEYEETVSKLVKGTKTSNPNFKRGIDMALGTLANCVGKSAGDMFEDEVLGATVERIKQENINLAPPVKKLSPDEKLARDVMLRCRKKYLAGRYLGKVSTDLVFLDQLKNGKDFKIGSEILKNQANDILGITIEKLEKKKDAMWRRKPLYSFYSKVKAFQTSEYARKFEARKRALDRLMLDKSIVKQIEELNEFKEKNQYLYCYQRMLRIRKRLSYIDPKQLSNKLKYLDEIADIMGEMYLSTKRILPQTTLEFNDMRIRCALGVFRQKWPCSLEDVNHVEIKHEEEMKKYFLTEINDTKNHKEAAFLNYEVACLINMKYESGGDMRPYCFSALRAAKRSGSVLWFLNSLFIISKAAFADNRFDEGLLTLIAARQASQKYDKIEQVQFIDRALLLLQYLTPKDFLVKRSALAQEEKFVKMMPTNALTAKAAQFIISVGEVPAWRRFTLPGSGTIKERMKEVKELRPFPKEKVDETDLIIPKDNWVAGLDDTEPYAVKDLWSEQKKERLLNIVYSEPRYLQFLSLEGEVKDYINVR